MNLQSLIVVLLRLMALNFLLRVAIEFMPQLLRFTQVYQDSELDHTRSLLDISWLFLGGLVLAAVLLWFSALPIARLVTRGVPHDLSFGSMSLVDCYSVAFIGAGLFYIARYLPQVLTWTHYLFKREASGLRDPEEGAIGYDLAEVFIPFILGVILFVNGRKWASALARRHGEVTTPVRPVGGKEEGQASKDEL